MMNAMGDVMFALIVGLLFIVMFIIGFWIGVEWQVRREAEQ